MPDNVKWWGEHGAPGTPCASAEQYRRRVGTYTMQLLFDFDGFLNGATCTEERFEFSPAARAKIQMHVAVLMEILRTGDIQHRAGAEQSDVDFQRFISIATRAAPRVRRRGRA